MCNFKSHVRHWYLKHFPAKLRPSECHRTLFMIDPCMGLGSGLVPSCNKPYLLASVQIKIIWWNLEFDDIYLRYSLKKTGLLYKSDLFSGHSILSCWWDRNSFPHHRPLRGPHVHSPTKIWTAMLSVYIFYLVGLTTSWANNRVPSIGDGLLTSL